MSELSPQAQAVLDAYNAGFARALEAVADQGEYVEIVTAPGFREIDAVLRVSDILAIAAELRCGTTPTETP